MRKVKRCAAAHRRRSEWKWRTLAKRVHRRYVRWIMREYGFVDGDWVRLIRVYDTNTGRFRDPTLEEANA